MAGHVAWPLGNSVKEAQVAATVRCRLAVHCQAARRIDVERGERRGAAALDLPGSEAVAPQELELVVVADAFAPVYADEVDAQAVPATVIFAEHFFQAQGVACLRGVTFGREG